MSNSGNLYLRSGFSEGACRKQIKVFLRGFCMWVVVDACLVFVCVRAREESVERRFFRNSIVAGCVSRSLSGLGFGNESLWRRGLQAFGA